MLIVVYCKTMYTSYFKKTNKNKAFLIFSFFIIFRRFSIMGVSSSRNKS